MTDTLLPYPPAELAAFPNTAGVKPLVAVVFTHNDANTLERCLASVASRVEALWVMDTGSTDDTVAIARRHTPHVYSALSGDAWCLWQETLTALRNDYPHDAWVLWLEPTDWLPTESQQQLERWHRLEAPTATGGFLLKHVLHHWNGQPLYWGNLTHHDCRLALLSTIRPDDHPVFCGWALEQNAPLVGVVIHHQPYGSFSQLLQGSLHWNQQRGVHQSTLGLVANQPAGMGRLLAQLLWHWCRYLSCLDGSAGLLWRLAKTL